MTSTTNAPYRAWHNRPALKDEVVERMRQHRAADEIIQGAYQLLDKETASGYRGCLIGCTLPAQPPSELEALRRSPQRGVEDPHGGWHNRVAAEYGIPATVGWLLDNLFELLDIGHAQFAVDSITAIPVGADLSNVCDRWAVDVLTDPTHGRIARPDWQLPDGGTDDADVRRRINEVADLFRRRANGDEPQPAEWAAYGKGADPWDEWDVRDAAAEAALVGWATSPTRDQPAYYSLMYGGGDSPYVNGEGSIENWLAARLLHHLRTAPVPAAA